MRLIRNNLFIGKNACYNIPQSCFFCANHPEKRIPIIFSCDIVKEMTAKLIHILKEAGLLARGDTIEMFLFVNYDFNSIENSILITLWDFVYKSRFSPEKYSMCMFTKFLKYRIDYFMLVFHNLKLGCLLVLQKHNNNDKPDI